jgi:protease I
MINPSLKGKRIGVVLENLYIPEEIQTYQRRFAEMGATVDLMSNLWNQERATFVNDIDGLDQNGKPNKPIQTLTVETDFQKIRLADYAAVLMAANYCSVRLRWFVPPQGAEVSAREARNAPAVKFFAEAMENPRIVKGALCHGLWIMTPRPEILKGRQVICHEVLVADITNAGAIYTPSASGVVVDGDLVTGHSAQEVEAYVDAIANQIVTMNGAISPALHS